MDRLLIAIECETVASELPRRSWNGLSPLSTRIVNLPQHQLFHGIIIILSVALVENAYKNTHMQLTSAEDVTRTRTSRLLLCDDSPMERMALATILRHEGYDVEESADGEAALHCLKHQAIDLLLLDLNMPEMDGFGVLAYLQKHRPGLPVVLLSGMPPDQIQHKMHRLPRHELPALFIKPIDPVQLLQIVELKLSGEMP
jgi:CheY-like chemotaxis protein